jgi:hypothetical protein
LKVMTKIAGSGSISQRHRSADPDPDPDPHQNVMDPQHCPQQCLLKQCCRGVTKSCLLSSLTNSALRIRVLMRGDGGCRVLANVYSCAHHMIWSPNKLLRSTSMCVADPYVFGPPGCGFISKRSGSGSFYHQAKE